MPSVLALAPEVDRVSHRKRWTRDEIARFQRAGLLDAKRLELVDGDLIAKVGKNRPHVETLVILVHLLGVIFGFRQVNFEAPIDVAPLDNPSSEPEPDIIVLKSSFRSFGKLTPQPADLALVVEISDSTLYFDLTVKAALYARAGIGDYWVVDTNKRFIVVHRSPMAGVYTSVAAYAASESIAPLASPASALKIADIFPG